MMDEEVPTSQSNVFVKDGSQYKPCNNILNPVGC